ncbi:hypothetical protein ACFL54_05855 [Planctomycetota bacterium]
MLLTPKKTTTLLGMAVLLLTDTAKVEALVANIRRQRLHTEFDLASLQIRTALLSGIKIGALAEMEAQCRRALVEGDTVIAESRLTQMRIMADRAIKANQPFVQSRDSLAAIRDILSRKSDIAARAQLPNKAGGDGQGAPRNEEWKLITKFGREYFALLNKFLQGEYKSIQDDINILLDKLEK